MVLIIITGSNTAKLACTVVLATENGTDHVVSMIFKRDISLVVEQVFEQLRLLLKMQGDECETCLNYEKGFCLQLFKFNTHGNLVNFNGTMVEQ